MYITMGEEVIEDGWISSEAVLHCSLPSWYGQFKQDTIPTRFVALSEKFMDYLKDDGPLVLPDSCRNTFKNTEADDSDDDWSQPEDGEDTMSLPTPSFPELEDRIKEEIAALGGDVFPKLNWSAPRDAHWISPYGSLKCGGPGDVFLLFKSSEFISHDLCMPFRACKGDAAVDVEHMICLRQWRDIPTSMEFRCFVHNRRLVGISQRDHTNYYPGVMENKDGIKDDILAFYRRKIKEKFPDPDYTFDVYRPREGKIVLIDFNPFSPVTDGLLFSWDELAKLDDLVKDNNNVNEEDDHVDVRIVEDQESAGLRASVYMTSRLPRDVIDLNNADDIETLVRYSILATHLTKFICYNDLFFNLQARMYRDGKLDPVSE
eukprot:m.316072 g.316072  ORF g.316072 m.316072 type:complete len:375 (-) comp16499_c0_seq13:1036-2160(-)